MITMPRCYKCRRYFKTYNGLKSHQSMVRRTGSHYPKRSNRRYNRRRRRRRY